MPVFVGMSGAMRLAVRKISQHALVAAAGARLLVQARHRLGVVVVDLGARLEHGANGVLLPLEVGDEHLDRAARELRVDLADGLGEDVRAEVRQVVAVHRGDHGVPQVQLGDGLRDARRLLDVVRRRAPVRDGAVGAVARADVAEDHERGRAVLPALADVRAVRFLADGVEVELLHHLLEAQVVRPAGRLDLQPRRLPLGKRVAAVSPHDLVELLGHVRCGKGNACQADGAVTGREATAGVRGQPAGVTVCTPMQVNGSRRRLGPAEGGGPGRRETARPAAP